ncbi:MAG: HupE/UreJ family protein [Siphonobacter sp.]
MIFNKKHYLLFLFLFFGLLKISAHPMPNSVLLLDVFSENIICKIHIPLKEMKLAVSFDVDNLQNLNLQNKELVEYLNSHFQVLDNNQKPLVKKLLNITTETTEQTGTGQYAELIADYEIPTNSRSFTIDYNAIIHQVNSHKAMVVVRQDWETGKTGEENTEVGVIGYSLNEGRSNLLKIDLKKGSNWTGFKSMVKLGLHHISEGTDHLMFLLVLLLTAPLICISRKWQSNPSSKQSFIKILKITLAFTIGHSLTLILATLGVLSFPSKIVEIIIALSILITAIHAIKAIFPNRENIVAIVFGLIHGLAFSSILSDLNLEKGRLALSLIGFNIGIELMQLIVILMVIPWLLLISRYQIYNSYKNILAGLAIISSLAWMVERITEKPNVVSKYLEVFTRNSILFVVFLFVSFVMFFVFKFKKNEVAR